MNTPYVTITQRGDQWVVSDARTGNPFAFFNEQVRAIEYAADLNMKYAKLQETSENTQQFLSENN